MSFLCKGVTEGEISISGVTASQFELHGVRAVGIRLIISGLLTHTVSSYTLSWKKLKKQHDCEIIQN